MQPDRRKNPPTLTEEQLRFFANENRRTARKATHKTLRGALVGYLILIVGVIAMYENGQQVSENERDAVVKSGRVVAVEGCNRDFEQQARIIKLLQRLKAANNEQFKRGKISAQQHDTAIKFYAAEIARASDALPDCRRAESILTSNPDADLTRIRPLYPSKPDKG